MKFEEEKEKRGIGEESQLLSNRRSYSKTLEVLIA
jgi:hypothetical protein